MTLVDSPTNSITTPPTEIPCFTGIKTSMQSLPFELLQWENFERLCYRLAGKDAEIESHSLYGRSGQAQHGIDIFARKPSGRYNTWQCKRYSKYTKTDLSKNISTFLSGHWKERSDRFYIAIQCATDDTTLQDAIEDQAKELKKQKIDLIVLGGYDLSSTLRDHPDIVLEFFGRACAQAFFGDTIDPAILRKLDGEEFTKARDQLFRVYSAGFELLDRIPVDAPSPFSEITQGAIPLLERFSPPDILIRESIIPHSSTRSDTSQKQPSTAVTEEPASPTKSEDGRQIEQLRRTQLTSWLAESDTIAIIGNAGSGKSTVLRCLSLDLLGDQKIFPAVAKKWGRHLPLFISFAKWVRLTEANSGTTGIKELLRASWQQQLTIDIVGLIDQAIDESRVILFVDGLDEWSNEQAARTTLQTMLTILSAHNIPVVVSARPRGLTKIGVIPENWSVGMLAPLSTIQQRNIATIWFSRNTENLAPSTSHGDVISWKIDRFFRELNKGRGLSTLAETPLLLLGLIALAIRRIVLPINKVQVLNQLIDVLLDVHPHSRATAAGDVVPRFSAAASTEVRRDALAALAFEMRTEGGDAGYPITIARQCIKRFLGDPDGYAYPAERAGLVAREILAVNSETIGLIVEKGPGEVGFAHASLEEYLASVHIQGWPIEEILTFVRSNASSVRWRSVFSDLIATTRRRSEAEQIVSVIDEYESDAVGSLQRRLLLAEVAFGGAEMNRTTAQRLASRSIEIIEGAGWLGERNGHLSAALEGLYNSTLDTQISKKINEWGIRRAEYLNDFYTFVGRWKQSEQQLYILKRGISDESPSNRRAAAHALAAAYTGHEQVEEWLVERFQGNTELSVTSASLEALVLGWPMNTSIKKLIEESCNAPDKPLQLSGIWSKVRLNEHNDTHLESLLQLLNRYTGIDYHHRDWATKCLISGWINNESVIKKCLVAIRRGQDDDIEPSAATNYLLSCDENNHLIINWILSELKQKHPFSTRLDGGWDALYRFAKANPKIQEALITCLTTGDMYIQEYMFRSIFEKLEDNRLKTYLIKRTRESDGFSVFWNFAPLIQGWAKNDDDVIELKKEVISWSDEDKASIIALFPLLMDKKTCRSELLRLTNTDHKWRLDLIISAFKDLDCSDDNEVIEALLNRVEKDKASFFSAESALISCFPNHPKVRKLAISLIKESNAPFTTLASAYTDDTEIQELIADKVNPLNASMRQIIIESIANEFDRNDASKKLLRQYYCEVDPDLRVQCSIRYHQALSSSEVDRELVTSQLLEEATAVGPDYQGIRAAAFAGLAAFGETAKFVPLQWNNKPLGISLGMYDRESQTLLRIMAENWTELSDIFDGALIDRIGLEFSSKEHFWNNISPYITSNEKLRKDFIEYCSNHNQKLEAQTLRALARELPKSDLLKKHCWSALNTEDKNSISPLDTYQSYFESSQILRDQFPTDATTQNFIIDIVKKSDFTHGIGALAIYDPQNELLDKLAKNLSNLTNDARTYCTPMILAGAKSPPDEFCNLLKLMINRKYHSIWDFQERINSAVRLRVGRDQETQAAVKKSLTSTPTESEISSLSRYLASTGNLDQSASELCQRLLNERYIAKGAPAHGFDVVADRIRPVAHSLLDVLASPYG